MLSSIQKKTRPQTIWNSEILTTNEYRTWNARFWYHEVWCLIRLFHLLQTYTPFLLLAQCLNQKKTFPLRQTSHANGWKYYLKFLYVKTNFLVIILKNRTLSSSSKLKHGSELWCTSESLTNAVHDIDKFRMQYDYTRLFEKKLFYYKKVYRQKIKKVFIYYI